MGRRKGETLKKEEMSQAKLNKHEPEAISKGQGRSSLTFVHTGQGQEKTSVKLTMTMKYRSSKCLEHFLFCL